MSFTIIFGLICLFFTAKISDELFASKTAPCPFIVMDFVKMMWVPLPTYVIGSKSISASVCAESIIFWISLKVPDDCERSLTSFDVFNIPSSDKVILSSALTALIVKTISMMHIGIIILNLILSRLLLIFLIIYFQSTWNNYSL